MIKKCSFDSLQSIDSQLLRDGISCDTPRGKAFLCTNSKFSLMELWFFYIDKRKDHWLPVTITYWRDNEDKPGDVLARSILFFDGKATFELASGDFRPTGDYVELGVQRLAVSDYVLFDYTKQKGEEFTKVRTVADAKVSIFRNSRQIGDLSNFPFCFSVLDDEGYCDFCYDDSAQHRELLRQYCTSY